MANPEISTLTATINTGIGAQYDDSKRQYDKIIISTDQDVDGLHIRVLIITYLLEYMPELIERGHVYYLDTPLYVNVMKGKKKMSIRTTKSLKSNLLKRTEILSLKFNGRKGLAN